MTSASSVPDKTDLMSIIHPQSRVLESAQSSIL
jgi:hypothetical protein